MKKILFIALISIFLANCGSSGGSNNESVTSTSPLQYAFFVDSAVEGISYTCNDITGLTEESGKFYYKDSCDIVFKIGDLVIGEINAKSINKDKYVLASEILKIKRENTRHKRVIELIQLLQSLDEDNNPYNNISITSKTHNAFKKEILYFKNYSIHDNKISSIILSLNKKITTRSGALKHYERNLADKFNIKINENYNFNYANQKVVKIVISTDAILVNKQILLYENQNIISLSVGMYEKLDNKIISTVFNKDGKLEISHTFANHVKDIWIVVPYYALRQRISISNLMEIRINKKGEIL